MVDFRALSPCPHHHFINRALLVSGLDKVTMYHIGEQVTEVTESLVQKEDLLPNAMRRATAACN